MTLFRGARGDPFRVGIAAAFLALLLHTMLYAAFLEDPVTWTLLGDRRRRWRSPRAQRRGPSDSQAPRCARSPEHAARVQRLLFVKSRTASFIELDERLLAERFDVHEIYQPGRFSDPRRS